MASDYDLSAAFKAIENELTASMIRNLKRHRAEETKEGYEWTMWQVEQLKTLEKYKKENQAKYKTQFENINAQIGAMIYAAKEQGGTDQEQKILRAMKKGFTAHKASRGATAEFFKLNKRKLESLVKATVDDMKRAETAVLRMANDQYRKIIYNAQVYANTGAGTYEKAVDMAAKDFLKSGINCIEYANGSRHTIADYADMAIRTAGKRAYLQGEGEKRKEWGISTVIVNKRGNPCPKCLPHCGKVYIDDVWSGGPKSGISPLTGIKYPLISSAIEGGLYHPRCKDSHTTYFEGISTPPEGSAYTRDELNNIVDQYKADQRQQYAERQAEKFERLEKNSLDEENQKRYAARREEWKKEAERQKITYANNSDSGIMQISNEVRYKGIPKTWKKLKKSEVSLSDVNPGYATNDVAFRTNCPNCVSAYEMRRRGYDVTARPAGKNHYLNRNPQDAWINPDVRETKGSGLDEIVNAFEMWPDNSRAEVAITWTGRANTGHVFVAEKVNGEIKFYDVQSGKTVSEDVFDYVETGKTKFWRIDNLDPSDRGITACKVGDHNDV